MTLGNPNHSAANKDSWRQDMVSYRRARLQRSLARLHTHPAVNPTGPHGPRGCVTPSPSFASSSATYAPSPSSTPNTSRRQSPESSEEVPPGIIPALFNDLVRRELGVDPSKSSSDTYVRLKSYLAVARAVTSTPSLSDPGFVTRLASGHEPNTLTDRKLLSSVSPIPISATPHLPRARDIHLAIQKAKSNATDAPKKLKPSNTFSDSLQLRRSTRKRSRSQRDTTVPSANQICEKDVTPNLQSGELAAFRPSPESVRRTRSAAARARRSSSNTTPSECCFCPNPEEFDDKELESELIGPFVDRRGNAKLFVHFDCACWAPQVYTDPANGQLRRVYDEYCRGRKLKCSSCGQKGATIGCYIQRCKRVFHYRCLEPAQAYCVERFFAAFCETHAHLGKKPSYKILMEAATIADVSAAQRRQDTTYGLDAPHSRYTMLRRRETEIIFSRKWRVSSHNGAFDDGKVVFSHRRKLVLGKADRISVGDCVRVLRTSALDIASGRLAFMAVAEKGEAHDEVTAVEARAAMASRESTGLLLLRNLRNAPRWGTTEIEVVRSIPMEISKTARASSTEKPNAETETPSQQHRNQSGEHICPRLSGQKRTPQQEGERGDIERDPDRKRPKVLSDKGDNYETGSDTPKRRASKTLPSARLPSFSRHAGSHTMPTMVAPQSASRSLKHSAKDRAVPQDPCAPDDTPTGQEYYNQRLHVDSIGKEELPSSGLPMVSLRLTCKQGRPPEDPCQAAQEVSDGRAKLLHNESSEVALKLKSTWEMFLEEQLPKERLLRPEDSMADSLRNMARLWSLMTTAERDAYAKRGRLSGISPPSGINRAIDTTPPRSGPASKCNAGLFSTAERSETKTQSGLKLRINTKENHAHRQPSVSLSAVKDVRQEERVHFQQNEQPNWDELFPSSLEDDLHRRTGCRPTEVEYRKIDRVRPPPTRGKAGS